MDPARLGTEGVDVSAFPDTNLLEQPTRRRIVEHLRLLPGDHFRSIMRTLHLSSGTAKHHLGVLEREGLVRSERMQGKLRYFASSDAAPPAMNELFKQYWKYRDLRVRVWSAVRRSADARPSTVAASVGVSRQLALYHLKALEELGMVVRSHDGYRALGPDKIDADWHR